MSERAMPLDPLAASLAALKPTSRLDRDRLIFLSGQASAARKSWAWPSATMGSLLLAAGLAMALAGERSRHQKDLLAGRDVVEPPTGSSTLVRNVDWTAEPTVANDTRSAAMRRYFESRELALADKSEFEQGDSSIRAAVASRSSRQDLLRELLPEATARAARVREFWPIY